MQGFEWYGEYFDRMLVKPAVIKSWWRCIKLTIMKTKICLSKLKLLLVSVPKKQLRNCLVNKWSVTSDIWKFRMECCALCIDS